MPSYLITAEGLDDLMVACPGCSGDALVLALRDREMQSYKVHRRSDDGRQWWFEVTFVPSGTGASKASPLTKMFCVCRIDD
ncbi:hypothetical protein [Synechococcus sp. BA-132 BA5]|jgi:hypothetical protein|uniref:hypothetical protein n=1 Tax=Synechococcus sp. BA-132 BA5 TaxID=3110252 RepID=UPI002B2155DF|nr:hypothetical protein [Synechococcus sp. BA-132 BA5]MEA5413770.1 hypothetical protein [Synechococcus sp. BA-132 BA5]